MRPQRKEIDCHTKAIIDALNRWEKHGMGHTTIITHRNMVDQHIDAARVFLMGKYPVLASRQMRNVTLGNKIDGSVKGLGFTINYYVGSDFVNGSERLRGLLGPVVVLEDAMLAHILSHGAHEELNTFIKIHNSKFEA